MVRLVVVAFADALKPHLACNRIAIAVEHVDVEAGIHCVESLALPIGNAPCIPSGAFVRPTWHALAIGPHVAAVEMLDFHQKSFDLRDAQFHPPDSRHPMLPICRAATSRGRSSARPAFPNSALAEIHRTGRKPRRLRRACGSIRS